MLDTICFVIVALPYNTATIPSNRWSAKIAENNTGNEQAEDSFKKDSGNIQVEEKTKPGLKSFFEKPVPFSVTSANDYLVICACAWQPVLITRPFWPLSR